MFLTLDEKMRGLLCCSHCKGTIAEVEDGFICRDCGSVYASKSVSVGDHTEKVYDFRVHRPEYCNSSEHVKWEQVQQEYEKFAEKLTVKDDLESYLAEIDCVKEIYEDEFHLDGFVLDVGGHQGRLRNFLSEETAATYVSADPFPDIFKGLQHQPNLLKAYPCLSAPCNFLSAHAESLPFLSRSFDWVHMRSVLDHFQDPYLSLKEAYRILKPGGRLLIGLSVSGGNSSVAAHSEKSEASGTVSRIVNKLRRDGVKGAAEAAIYHLKRNKDVVDDHMFHWDYDDLVDLIRRAGFEIVKEHWQKPPFTMCIYLSAGKKDPSPLSPADF